MCDFAIEHCRGAVADGLQELGFATWPSWLARHVGGGSALPWRGGGGKPGAKKAKKSGRRKGGGKKSKKGKKKRKKGSKKKGAAKSEFDEL